MSEMRERENKKMRKRDSLFNPTTHKLEEQLSKSKLDCKSAKIKNQFQLIKLHAKNYDVGRLSGLNIITKVREYQIHPEDEYRAISNFSITS